MSLITVKDVATKLGVSVSGVWKMVKDKECFPKPFKLSTKRTRWYSDEVEAYVQSFRS